MVSAILRLCAMIGQAVGCEARARAFGLTDCHYPHTPPRRRFTRRRNRHSVRALLGQPRQIGRAAFDVLRSNALHPGETYSP